MQLTNQLKYIRIRSGYSNGFGNLFIKKLHKLHIAVQTEAHTTISCKQ